MTKDYGSFTMSVKGREWKVDVARELVEDALRIERVSADQLDEWVDAHAVILSDIAIKKIEGGRSADVGGDWVRITSADFSD